MWVESEVGRGSTFHFTAAFARPKAPAIASVADNRRHWTDSGSSSSTTMRPTAESWKRCSGAGTWSHTWRAMRDPRSPDYDEAPPAEQFHVVIADSQMPTSMASHWRGGSNAISGCVDSRGPADVGRSARRRRALPPYRRRRLSHEAGETLGPARYSRHARRRDDQARARAFSRTSPARRRAGRFASWWPKTIR